MNVLNRFSIQLIFESKIRLIFSKFEIEIIFPIHILSAIHHPLDIKLSFDGVFFVMILGSKPNLLFRIASKIEHGVALLSGHDSTFSLWSG
jgi:hypothetical protein